MEIRFLFSATVIQSDLWQVRGPGFVAHSTQTVRHRLHEGGVRAHRRCKKPALTAAHKHQRLQFAWQHMHWNRNQWRRVIWSDESRLCLRMVDGRIKVWRRRGDSGERHQNAHISPTTGTMVEVSWCGMQSQLTINPPWWSYRETLMARDTYRRSSSHRSCRSSRGWGEGVYSMLYSKMITPDPTEPT